MSRSLLIYFILLAFLSYFARFGSALISVSKDIAIAVVKHQNLEKVVTAFCSMLPVKMSYTIVNLRKAKELDFGPTRF